MQESTAAHLAESEHAVTMHPLRIRLHQALVLPTHGLPGLPWISILINRLSCAQTTGRKLALASSANPRLGFDGLGELLTACVAVLKRLFLKVSALQDERHGGNARMAIDSR